MKSERILPELGTERQRPGVCYSISEMRPLVRDSVVPDLWVALGLSIRPPHHAGSEWSQPFRWRHSKSAYGFLYGPHVGGKTVFQPDNRLSLDVASFQSEARPRCF